MDPQPTGMATADTSALADNFYHRVLSALPTQLAVYSPHGVFEFVTPSAVADPDTRAWIIGRTDHEYAQRRGLPDEIPNRRRQFIDHVVQSGEPVTFEESFATRDGEMRCFRRYLTPVKSADGRVEHVIGHGIDITEQRRVEEQLRQAQRMTTHVDCTEGTATILVAEDEPGVRLLMVRILRLRGYRMLEASSGAEALALLEAYHGSIDVLLTDVVMSDFGGRTLADAARVLRPELKVLYVSGYADEDHLLDAGNPTESFLEKPFTVDGLAQRVHALLQVSTKGSPGVSSGA